MTDDQLQRLKEASVFIAPPGGRTGSGYLIAPQRIGTAEHVVADWDHGAYYEVLIGVGTARATRATAKVIKRDKTNDAAVLEVLETLNNAPLDVASPPQADVTWESFGFPAAARGEDAPGGLRIGGKVSDPQARSKLAQPALQLFSEAVAAGAGAPLHGFSGAPVVVAGALVGHLTRHIGQPDDRRTPSFGAVFACPIQIVLGLLDVPPRWASGQSSVPLDGVGQDADFDVGELLAWCDRTEVLRRLSGHVGTEDSPSAALLCTVGHAGNRPRPMLDRIGIELSESPRRVRTATRHTGHDFGYQSPENFAELARDALGLENDQGLGLMLQQHGLDLLLLCHYVDCERMSARQIKLLISNATAWLGGLLIPNPHRFVFALNMRFGTLPWYRALTNLGRGPRESVLAAYSRERSERAGESRRFISEPLLLTDYSKEDVRKWLDLARVRKGLGPRSRTVDEKTLEQWFRGETCGHEPLSRRIDAWFRKSRDSGGGYL